MNRAPWTAFVQGALLSLSLVVLFSSVSALANVETIRVRVDRVNPSVTLTGMALRYPGSKTIGDFGFHALKIRWSKASSGLFEWAITDRDSGERLASFRARKLEIEGMGVRVNLKSVPDRLTMVPVRSQADLIGTMNIENYLLGVLPAEMPAGWPLESLKAQAVAARTFALHRKSLRKASAYDVESDVMDQVFVNPLRTVPSDGGSESNVARAVRETAGQILSDDRGAPVAAYFHADCGGRTEEAREVWGTDQRSGSAIDAACPLNPGARWKLSLTAAEIRDRLRTVKADRPVSVATLTMLEPIARTPSGRIARMRIKWSDGSSEIVSGHTFRMLIGHDRVKSTNFNIIPTGDGFEFRGQGFGHGVGLCQWGAKHMASTGADYQSILQHYYPKASIIAYE